MIATDILITDELIQGLPEFEQKIWQTLENVKDPEIPTMSVVDMGMVRGITVLENKIEVIVTPTYSGCPATLVIRADVEKELKKHFPTHTIIVINRLSPAWTTDWMTDKVKSRLLESKIAPPIGKAKDNASDLLNVKQDVLCPYCFSKNTSLESFFGTTACKSLYKCNTCLMPFDHFKCH